MRADSGPEAESGAVIRRIVTICNKRGLHARAAAKLVKLAGGFDAEIEVAKNGNIVSGQSIMGLLTLAAAIGSVIEIRATGTAALEAADAIARLVTDGFNEE
jgi:phosphocarrier protein HPr